MTAQDPQLALEHAILIHNLNEARQAIKRGADINAPDSNGIPPLHSAAGIAVDEGKTEMLELLLDHGAKIDTRDGDNNTIAVSAMKLCDTGDQEPESAAKRAKVLTFISNYKADKIAQPQTGASTIASNNNILSCPNLA